MSSLERERELLASGMMELGIQVRPDTLESLLLFLDEVVRWNGW